MTERTTRLLAHEVRAVHATSRAPIPVRAEFVADPPRGWALRVAGATVVVTRTPTSPAPAPPARVRLTATDDAYAGRLAQPVAEVGLTAPVVTHEFAMAPAVLEVRLVRPDGTPRTGVTLRARPTGGGTMVPLPEDPAQPGTYRSAPRAWAGAFHPLEVRVDATTLRRMSIDLTKRVTRVRLVDPT